MSLSRRTALSVLGIASASAAVAGEDLAKPLRGFTSDSSYRFGLNDKVSAVLRRMADDIDARGTLPQEMTLHSRASVEDFLSHTLTINFILLADLPPKA